MSASSFELAEAGLISSVFPFRSTASGVPDARTLSIMRYRSLRSWVILTDTYVAYHWPYVH